MWSDVCFELEVKKESISRKKLVSFMKRAAETDSVVEKARNILSYIL